jgi:hypothetical protein
MRLRFLYLAIVLHVATAYASDRVQYSARVYRLRTEEDRAEWCGPHKRIEACTRFVDPHVTASAVEENGAWRISANAQFIAMIALQDESRYGHEMNHVHDVESAIDAYLLDLRNISFPSREACEQARADLIEKFDARVRSFVEASNLRRDGNPHPDR